MAFKDFAQREQGVELLERSLERRRLAHAYLFTGHALDELEEIARTLAKTLNCLQPVKRNGVAVDCCDECLNCRKIEHGNHADVHWIRPESKSRIITVEQIRDLMREIQLKPTEAAHKVAIIVAADRLKTEAANAFLKTLEEPPSNSVLILTTTDRQRILDTILSRCLLLSFAGEGPRRVDPEQMRWLSAFSEMAAKPRKSLLGRYQLMDVLLRKLNEARQLLEQTLSARSPLQKYPDAEKNLQDKWEDELKASIEAEYRRVRADWLSLLQNWLRDVWLQTLNPKPGSHRLKEFASFPDLPGAGQVAARISAGDALENLNTMEQLQRLLATNVQEALAIEVGLLRLHL